jgi:hypothetical protein
MRMLQQTGIEILHVTVVAENPSGVPAEAIEGLLFTHLKRFRALTQSAKMDVAIGPVPVGQEAGESRTGHGVRASRSEKPHPSIEISLRFPPKYCA